MPTYTVRNGQNLYDVAVQLYGSVEGLFDLMISNPNLSMSSNIKFGDVLEYHDTFVINQTIKDKIDKLSIVPTGSARNVYFKRPDADLLMIVGINADEEAVSFNASGYGEMLIDWGDNSPLQTVVLNSYGQVVEHYFDNETELRRIKVYGDNSVLSFTHLDTTNLKGALILCKPLIVDEYVCLNTTYSLTGLSLFKEIYRIDLSYGNIDDLLPIGNLSLQELDLRGVNFLVPDALDDYLEYIREHYNDRRPCTIYLSTEPGEKGYEAMNTILGEPEWNVSDTWKFYINNQLYTIPDGTNS